MKDEQKNDPSSKEKQSAQQNTSNQAILKKHKQFFYTFLILSILSLIDIGTREMVYAQLELTDIGYISLLAGAIFESVSASLASIAMVSLGIIFSFAILWIPIAIIEYYKIKKLKKEVN